ncbi:MAG: tRNA guanosine(34) transglycosylase Tgt [Pirellulales bacterium]|nr:tRNA guanosine(34) transglycosylase Tgt [Pirellulales bacterium]
MPLTESPFRFRVLHVDAHSRARRATFQMPHGAVEMPAFMPVGTQGTVKGLEVEMLRATEAQMVLANTYHLALRPGEKLVEELGGLHKFMGWDGPILTDSGGFQIFSLAANVEITEELASFRSHIDGNLVELTPERAVAIQESLGSDVAMVLDHVVSLPSEPSLIREAMERSVRWAKRAKAVHRRSDQAQFAIVQGGLNAALRLECTAALRELDFPGYAIGGLSVGEPPAEMYRILDETTDALPAEKPRYLMGVGRPQDLLEAIARGVDLFDCVLPTRNGRNAMAFTDEGTLRLRNGKFTDDRRPLEEHCPCPACRRSRAYLRHLFIASEMLGPILLSAHNITYYQRLMADARQAIEADRFEEFRREKQRGWARGETVSAE